MLQHLELEGDGRRRQAEIGEVGVDERRAADIGADRGLGRRNALARDVGRSLSMCMPMIARPALDIN